MIPFWIVLGVILACGTQDPRPHHDTDSEFWPYIALFEVQTEAKVEDVPVHFDAIDPDHAGECWSFYSFEGLVYEVAIDPHWWFDHPDPTMREILISHELGHCVLDRDHDPTLMLNQQPFSIMYPSLAAWDPGYFEANRESYYAELVANSRIKPQPYEIPLSRH
jgi:hypothetical protein